jgi:hypothetical protein
LGIILYLIAKNVVVDVVLLGRLWGQNKGLHEPSHRSVVVGKLAQDLHDDPGGQGGMSVHLTDLGLAVTKVQLHNLLVNFLLSVDLGKNKTENPSSPYPRALY